MWRIIVEKGSQKGLKVNINGDGSFTIGRQNTNKLALEDMQISRKHCRLTSKDGRLFIEDLNSSHGTVVNYEKVSKKELCSNDLIFLGDTELWVVGGEPDLFLGKNIYGYMFHFLLGRGGQGVVYLAEQVNLQRTVAVKVLNKDLCDDQKYRDSFISEAKLAAALNHENLIGIYDIYDQDGIVFFSMEHMSGGSIADVISSSGKIAIADCITYLLQAARGLDHIHSKGYIHKDIKPGNLMIAGDGVLKIGDFGITSSDNKKNKGVVLGSPHYMSPEHILNKTMDTRSDLYSLGCSAYRMMTGKLPFTGKSIKEIVTAHLREKAPSFKGIDKNLNTKTAVVLDKLLNKSPEHRYSTAKEFIDSLEDSLSTSSTKKKKKSSSHGLHKKKIYRRR